MKANIAKKVLLCTLSAALLAAPCAGVSAAGTGAGTKAASSGSSITAEVEEIVTANAWVGSDDNSGSGSSVTVAQVPVTSSVGGEVFSAGCLSCNKCERHGNYEQPYVYCRQLWA